MGALLISNNDLIATEPRLALGIEAAVARAVASRQATFRASIERSSGQAEVRLLLEEHRGGQPHPIKEVRIDPRCSAKELQRRIELGIRGE